MLLVIDVGTTQTESLDRMWRVATNRDHTADELRVKLLPLLQSENLQASDITGAALASVVPQLTGAWTRAVQDLAGVRAVVCSAKTAGTAQSVAQNTKHSVIQSLFHITRNSLQI